MRLFPVFVSCYCVKKEKVYQDYFMSLAFSKVPIVSLKLKYYCVKWMSMGAAGRWNPVVVSGL